jgi:hypothetical protein
MLRISVVDRPNQRRLVVEGQLIGPWVAELRTTCDKARADLQGELVVDVSQLSAISQEGENVLFELMKAGVKFRCRGVYTKQVLRQLARRASRSQQQRRK